MAPDRHVRLYRAVLTLYPRSFKRDFREPMVQLFGDCVRTDGTKAWRRALPDLVRTIPAQRIEALMARLRRSTGTVAALLLIVLGFAALAVGRGIGVGFLPVLLLGLVLLVAAQRQVFTPVFRGERAPLRHALVQAWWAPVAGLLGFAMIFFGIGTVFEAHNWGGRVFGSAILFAFGFGMLHGLRRRPFARETANALILVTTLPAMVFFWVIVPTVAALLVWVGVLTSGFSDEPLPAAPAT
jgi:hypothetical protein